MLSLYDFPAVYDAVMDRPADVVQTEVQTVQTLLARHGIAEGRILELACGTCAHGIPLAQRGFSVTGIDRAAAMLAEARRRAAAAAVEIALVQADVIAFELDQQPFDCAIFLFETFELITAYADLVRHFQAVRRHLKPDGLYIIDLHANRRGVGTSTGEWGRRTIALEQGQVETWNEDFPGDWVQGTGRLALHCRITLDGVRHETRDDWSYRVYSPWELALLMRTLDGWRIDGFYSWRNLSTEIANEEHYFMVLQTSS